MKPIPVVFHIGPVQLHTYGLGLAITFWFAYRYLDRRLRAHGYPEAWLGPVAAWVIVAALVGARVAHVLANLSSYVAAPAQIVQVWHGGLSSFGGLAFAVPAGFLLARRRAGVIPTTVLADLVAPVLLAAWTVGRLLGPQLMYKGGGHPTHLWFGMYYAGQVGRRLPVPIFQSLMTFAVLLIAWRVERYVESRGGPRGLVTAVTLGFWGLNRFLEEHLWLAYPGHAGAIAVQVAGVAISAIGFGWALALWYSARHRGRPDTDGAPAVASTSDPAAV